VTEFETPPGPLSSRAAPRPRAPGYSATAAYLVVAVAILLWSVRRWAYRQRAASLMPLLLIADAVLTVLILHATWHA